MINLLPSEQKSEIRAARTNVLLVRYTTLFGVSWLVIAGIIFAAYSVLSEKQALAESLAETNAIKTAPYQSIRAEADVLRTSLTDAKTILDQKISYSKAVYEIASSIPQGVILETLELDPSTFGTPMTLNASAKSFESASQLKDKFANNTEVFSDVKLLTLESGDTAEGSETGSSGGYPVKVSISVIINKAAL